VYAGVRCEMDDPIVRAIVLIVGSYLVLLMGRALAARIAGDNADLALNFVPFPFSILTDLVNALPYQRRESDDRIIDGETGNTETLDNTEQHGETLLETQMLMQVTDTSGQRLVPRITDEEWDRFEIARRNAIVLLNRCVLYYRDHPEEKDDGKIPRYNKLGMKSENRGSAVDDLWESGFCSKGNSGTYIFPEVARSCAELYQHIVKRDPKYRVFPYGYERQHKDVLDSAVQALPENVH